MTETASPDFAKIMELLSTQTAAMQQLQTSVLQLQTQASAPPASPTAPPQTTPPSSAAPTFIAPMTPNPAAGTSTSLLAQFPTIEAATISAILSHDLRATELFKLDSRYRDKTERQVLAFNGNNLEIASRDSLAKEYKSLNSVSVPLGTYFSVLLAAVPITVISELRTLGQSFLWYTTHLLKLSADYEWAAVLAYHTDFFNTRRREMTEGTYAGWGRIDHDLHGEHLMDHRKRAPAIKLASTSSSARSSSPRPFSGDPCRNFNSGNCTTTPCTWKRPHVCSTCGKADHNALTHPSN